MPKYIPNTRMRSSNSERRLASFSPQREFAVVQTRSAAAPSRRNTRLTIPAAILGDRELRKRLEYGFDSERGPVATAMAESLARAFGPSAMAVIHYGSRARAVDARSDSAYDFFVIVDDYRAAYEHLMREMPTGRGPRTARVLAHVLAPNVHAIPPVPEGERANKCAVLSIDALQTAAGLTHADHFIVARLFQHVQLLWERDPGASRAVRDALTEIRARTFEWGRSFLPESFDAEEYARVLLDTSFAGDIRPESGERASHLVDAQRDILVAVYSELLDALADAGVLVKDEGRYRQAEAPTARDRRRWERYFALSKARGVARWSKHIIQYDGWLDYIVHKITRHNEVQVELTERERRWPLIFLWPKVFLFFRERSRWETKR
jgi:hypothetical protein